MDHRIIGSRVAARVCLVGLLALASDSAAAPHCELAAGDRAWLERALAGWERAARKNLRTDVEPLPWVVVFDSDCVWHVNADTAASSLIPRISTDTSVRYATGSVAVRGVAHGGRIRLPDGDDLPPALTAFTAPYGRAAKPYLVMALPRLWQMEPRHSDQPDLPALVRSVFIHEMTHTRQVATIGPRLDAISARHRVGDLDDDIIQKRFAGERGFREAYERERDLLYEAAREATPARRQAIVQGVIREIEQRRARYFTGRDAFYAELEDLFLNMEGVANWTAYRAVVADGFTPDAALALIRRDGRRWSQDEGLAIFLVLESLGVKWRPHVLGADPAPLLDLLKSGVRTP